jgi:uncharacterized protein (TIGR03067 family)
MKITLKESPGFAALSLLLPCVLLCLQAGCTTHSPTASELHRLQGTWEGVVVGDKARDKITITITGDSFHFHRDSNFWFATTITLPEGTDPQQLRATIKHSAPPEDSIGKVVVAIFKIEDGILTFAMNQYARLEAPKSFEANEEKGTIRYEFRKVQPQKKNTDYPNPNEQATATAPAS